MNATPRQLAKLRQLGRYSRDLEGRHAACREQGAGARDYLLELQRQLELLPRMRDAKFADSRSPEEYRGILEKHDAEVARVKGEIEAGRAELAELQEELGAITAVSWPLRELIGRLLRRFNLDRRAAGISFDNDERGSEPIEPASAASQSSADAPAVAAARSAPWRS